jgi:hypothetical protein
LIGGGQYNIGNTNSLRGPAKEIKMAKKKEVTTPNFPKYIYVYADGQLRKAAVQKPNAIRSEALIRFRFQGKRISFPLDSLMGEKRNIVPGAAIAVWQLPPGHANPSIARAKYPHQFEEGRK